MACQCGVITEPWLLGQFADTGGQLMPFCTACVCFNCMPRDFAGITQAAAWPVLNPVHKSDRLPVQKNCQLLGIFHYELLHHTLCGRSGVQRATCGQSEPYLQLASCPILMAGGGGPLSDCITHNMPGLVSRAAGATTFTPQQPCIMPGG